MKVVLQEEEGLQKTGGLCLHVVVEEVLDCFVEVVDGNIHNHIE